MCHGRTGVRSGACASVLAVVSALVDLASLSGVARLTATLGDQAGVEEAAPAVLARNIAGPCGGSCGTDGRRGGSRGGRVL